MDQEIWDELKQSLDEGTTQEDVSDLEREFWERQRGLYRGYVDAERKLYQKYLTDSETLAETMIRDHMHRQTRRRIKNRFAEVDLSLRSRQATRDRFSELEKATQELKKQQASRPGIALA